ncbi:hypothetical protein Tco_0426852, partial [Tanacetum coccineum]
KLSKFTFQQALNLHSSDNVKYRNSVSIVLGLCEGLGFATNELQERLVKKRIGSS